MLSVRSIAIILLLTLSNGVAALALGPRFLAGATAFGYADVEIVPTPNPGGSYHNVTSSCLRIWSGAAWSCSAGGGAVSSVANSNGTLTVSPTTGAVITSLALGHANTWTAVQQAPNIILHLKDYGAFCDGAHQSADTTALTSALTAMGTTGSTLVVPAGNCQINNSSGAIAVTNLSGTIEGEGPGASFSFSTLGTDGIDFTTPTNLTVRDLSFSYAPTATARTSGYPLSFAQATGLKLINLTLTNGNLSAMRVSSSTNVYLENITMSNFEANGLFLINNKYLSANGIHSSNNGDAPFEVSWYDSEYTAHSVPCQFVTMSGLTSFNDVHGIIVDGCLDVSISNFDIASTQHDAIEVQQSSAISAAAWPDNVTISNGTIRDTGYSSGSLNDPTINAITIFTSNVPPAGTYQHVELNNIILRHIGGECVRENDNTSFIVGFNNIDCNGAGATGTTGSNGRFQAGLDLNGWQNTFSGVTVSNSGGPALYLFDSVFTLGTITSNNPNSTSLTTNAIYNASTGNIQLAVNIIDLRATDASKITDTATAGAHFFGPITVSTSNTWLGTSSANTGGVTQFILAQTPSTPTLSVPGGTYQAYQSVTITDATPGASIYYTVTGVTPTIYSTQYTGPISVNRNMTLKAIAAVPGGPASPVSTASYSFAPAVAPAFSKAAGVYQGPQSIAISDATTGAAIYYTVTGVTPTTGSTRYTGPITVSSNMTLKAIAAVHGGPAGPVSTASYTFVPAVAPTFSKAAGVYQGPQSIAISDATTGAAIYYTVTGVTPTTGSTRYTGPITLSSNMTLKAIAAVPGGPVSAVASAVYSIVPAVTPVFSTLGGTYQTYQSITISDATAGAAIYYTTTGVTPTIYSTQYTGPISVNRNMTLKAIAAVPGGPVSAVATASYTFVSAVAPTFSTPGGTYQAYKSVTITDATAGASIYYTVTGVTPTIYSTQIHWTDLRQPKHDT